MAESLHSVQEASQALTQQNVVLVELAGRWVTVNALSQAEDGNWVMSWSHRDFPDVHVDHIDDSVAFIIRGEYASYRRPGRPKERNGEYEHTAIDIRRDLLVKLDAKRGNKSRREYVEQWLETL